MKHYVTLLLLLSSTLSQAQQWLDKQYTYDSMLQVVYGTAINFNMGVDTLEMDIYTPVCDNPADLSRRPLLLWIHGGAFLAGSKEDPSITRLCKAFARRGYVTASINYRLGFVSDDQAWNCNFPEYSCVFATDEAEWYRAAYRGIQDGKGALRYLINRHATFNIDTNNVFVAGESAGAFLAMGIALLDTTIERMPQTYAMPAAPKPSANTLSCVYNANQSFTSDSIARPDLGGILGAIEPSNVQFTIKGIGNNFGAMTNNLLQYHPAGKPKPAIYSFHRPCDMVVPIDSGVVYQYLSWCFTNGFGCNAIANTPKVYGSRIISKWNTNNNLGYNIHNEFTVVNFPFNYLFGTGSCADQINNPCHAYDNASLRENNLANFFSGLITSAPLCDSTSGISAALDFEKQLSVYPNPVQAQFTVKLKGATDWNLLLMDMFGKVLVSQSNIASDTKVIDLGHYPAGMYHLSISDSSGRVISRPLVKI